MKKTVPAAIFAVALLGIAGATVASFLAGRSAADRAFEVDILITGSANRHDASPIAQGLPEEASLDDAVSEEAAPLGDLEPGNAVDPVSVEETIGPGAEPQRAALASSGLLSIRRDSDRIEMTGAVAGVENADELVSAAKKAFPSSAIKTTFVPTTNLPRAHAQAAMLAITALSRLAEGNAQISGREIVVTGRALYAQTPALLAARLEDEVPDGWSVSLDIDAPERIGASGGAECQQRIVALLAEDQIGFAVAAATIETETEPLLDELAEILGQCPDVAVEVAGHTDSDGSETANRRLSQERAAAVRRALSERGVEAERLSAVGYGQAQPIAPNDTPENKARNRRIELIVIE